MAQLFHPSANTLAKATILGGLLTIVMLAFAAGGYDRSPYSTLAGVPIQQPIPFSHEHHAGGLGIHCLYCHTSVMNSAYAGMPTTHTCMTCHSQIWADSPMLEPVRASLRSGKPLHWTRVHDLPDFAYFDHSIHVHKGVGCSSCHGNVASMPLIWKEHSLRMEWCLECHRDPAQYLRPQDQIFSMNYRAENQPALGAALLRTNHVNLSKMTNCSICHR